MGTMILISSVAILVAIIGCVVIWRMDAARADEVEHRTPQIVPRHALGAEQAATHPRPIDS